MMKWIEARGELPVRYRSIFDIIGPSMVGPSSSHTAGANRIGQLANQIFGEVPEQVKITFYGSFAETYQGHGTDRAVIAGLLGMKTDDLRIRDSLDIAASSNVHISIDTAQAEGVHPNCVRIELKNVKKNLNIVGISTGGGSIEIIELNGYDIRFSGSFPTILIEHIDQIGMIHYVTSILKEHGINVSHMEVDRHHRNGAAITVIEMDQMVSEQVIEELKKEKAIVMVKILEVV